jgi:hypothetical protein
VLLERLLGSKLFLATFTVMRRNVLRDFVLLERLFGSKLFLATFTLMRRNVLRDFVLLERFFECKLFFAMFTLMRPNMLWFILLRWLTLSCSGFGRRNFNSVTAWSANMKMSFVLWKVALQPFLGFEYLIAVAAMAIQGMVPRVFAATVATLVVCTVWNGPYVA